ncbi:MAG TPA: TMEM175 family protein [Nitrospiraceae bacterium]|jgi:uncharacterized membrane protein|nr:TMEM175 family protein [Nitrospiraceae bacterium]
MSAQQIYLKYTFSHDRLCAVSDGVYAIALTLLVLDLKVPELSGITNRQLITDLVQQLPNFFAYIIGFSVVAFFWMNHHRIFKSITCCDRRALVLNFVHLLFISLTPYVASLIGHYEGDRIATIAFSLSLGLASLSLIVLGRYVLARENWRTDATGGTWVKIPLWAIYAGPGVALVSIGISFVNIDVALFLWLLLPLREVLFMIKDFPAPSSSGHN